MEAILTSTFLINTTKILKFRDKLKQRSNLKFSDGDGPNLCRVKKWMLVPHLLKIYFGLGWPSSVLEIVSSQRLKTNSW